MQVEAIYRQGRVELLQPLRLKRDNVRVIVTVPAEEVAVGMEGDMPEYVREPLDPARFPLTPEVIERARQARARLDDLLHAPLPPDESLPEAGADYDERLQAFGPRARMCQESDRPA